MGRIFFFSFMCLFISFCGVVMRAMNVQLMLITYSTRMNKCSFSHKYRVNCYVHHLDLATNMPLRIHDVPNQIYLQFKLKLGSFASYAIGHPGNWPAQYI